MHTRLLLGFTGLLICSSVLADGYLVGGYAGPGGAAYAGPGGW